ncbi:MAG: hypothetical protein RMK29_09350 [Myxococcales bacterium]|nr:hypothetical protein [Myxococcales bacterium]
MRALMTLLASGLLVVTDPARAQSIHDPHDDHFDDSDYYQPPPEGGVRASGSFGYAGIHPIPYDVGVGFCYTQSIHFHPYQPFDVNLFHQVNGYYYFVGDPYDFGYNRSLFWYRGHHPVPLEFGDGFCYMSWPHRHHYPPTPMLRAHFHLMGGHYVYIGPWAPAYYQDRDRYLQYYNDYYRSYYFGNRYYRIRPQPIFRPGVSVQVNLPGVSVGFGGIGRPRVYGVPAVPPPAPYRSGYVPAPPAYGGTPGGYVPPPAPAIR